MTGLTSLFLARDPRPPEQVAAMYARGFNLNHHQVQDKLQKSAPSDVAGAFRSEEMLFSEFFASDQTFGVSNLSGVRRMLVWNIQFTFFIFVFQPFPGGGRLFTRRPKSKVALEHEEHSVFRPSGVTAKWKNKVLKTKQKTTRPEVVNGGLLSSSRRQAQEVSKDTLI